MRQAWSTQRMGYLDEATFTYALALYAWSRGEMRPSRQRHLASNIASCRSQP